MGVGHVPGTSKCHYGTQPGYWIPTNGSTGVWQLYDEHCQLRDLVGPHIQVWLVNLPNELSV
jgi:hypothetical protein